MERISVGAWAGQDYTACALQWPTGADAGGSAGVRVASWLGFIGGRILNPGPAGKTFPNHPIKRHLG